MKSLSLILLSVLALSMNVQAKSNETLYNSTVQAQYYFACARGFLQGAEIGLYALKTYTVSPHCLGSDAVAESVQLAEYLEGNANITFFQATSSLYNLYYNFDKYCQFSVIFHDLLNFYANPDNDTTPTTLL